MVFISAMAFAICFENCSICIDLPDYILENGLVISRVLSNESQTIRVNGYEYKIPKGKSELVIFPSEKFEIECKGERIAKKVTKVENGKIECKDLREVVRKELKKLEKGRECASEEARVLRNLYGAIRQKVQGRDIQYVKELLEFVVMKYEVSLRGLT